jgi:hypothetical protein
VNYFLAGEPGGLSTTKRFLGPATEDFLETDELALSAAVWTPCGADTILRTNTTFYVRSNRRNDEAMATLDSIDLKSGLVYHLAWRTCK